MSRISKITRRGNIRNVEACFTKLENKNNRELTDTKYGGSFLELGSYVLLPILKIFGTEFDSVDFSTINADNGLDIFTKAFFKFPNGMATATCGLGVKSEGKLLISGTEGYIVVEPPWWKTNYFEVHYEDSTRVEKYNEVFLDDGLRYELSDLVACLNGIDDTGFKLTDKESIAMSSIMEKFLAR